MTAAEEEAAQLCLHCLNRKGKMNPAKGKMIPFFGTHGKCIRPGGFCDKVRAVVEATRPKKG